MTMKRFSFALPALGAAATLLIATPVLAADPYLGLEYAQGIGLPNGDVRTLIAGIIRAFMGLLGVILILQIMWGGFLLMTHGGSEEKHKHATGVIKDAVIGMVIIMTASSSAKFVVDAVMNAASGTLS